LKLFKKAVSVFSSVSKFQQGLSVKVTSPDDGSTYSESLWHFPQRGQILIFIGFFSVMDP
jgi:hypothetical protein